jgi:hypothetical protein
MLVWKLLWFTHCLCRHREKKCLLTPRNTGGHNRNTLVGLWKCQNHQQNWVLCLNFFSKPSCELDEEVWWPQMWLYSLCDSSIFRLLMSKDNFRRPQVWICITKWFSNYENLWTWNLWYVILLNSVTDCPGLELWNTDTSGIIFSFVDMDSEKWGQFYPELRCSCIRIIKLWLFPS